MKLTEAEVAGLSNIVNPWSLNVLMGVYLDRLALAEESGWLGCTSDLWYQEAAEVLLARVEELEGAPQEETRARLAKSRSKLFPQHAGRV